MYICMCLYILIMSNMNIISLMLFSLLKRDVVCIIVGNYGFFDIDYFYNNMKIDFYLF